MIEEVDVNANPYAYFRCFRVTFHTKQHAQMMGVMSFSLFICMVVITLYSIGSLSLFYITIGVIIYSFLMRAIFHAHAEKTSVLAYLVFESMQIGLLAALIVYLIMPILFAPVLNCESERNGSNSHRGSYYYQDCQEKAHNAATERVEQIQFLVCLILLAIIKFYFTRVFSRFYKYLLWAERKSSNLHAQYWNARGVRINVEDVFANGSNVPSPHVVWSNNGNSYVLNLGTLPTLPSYNQVIGSVDEMHSSKPQDSALPMPVSDATTFTTVDSHAPPTWDGEVSSALTTPPTYVLPTQTTADKQHQQYSNASPQQEGGRQRSLSSILQKQIPMTSGQNELSVKEVDKTAHKQQQLDKLTALSDENFDIKDEVDANANNNNEEGGEHIKQVPPVEDEFPMLSTTKIMTKVATTSSDAVGGQCYKDLSVENKNSSVYKITEIPLEKDSSETSKDSNL